MSRITVSSSRRGPLGPNPPLQPFVGGFDVELGGGGATASLTATALGENGEQWQVRITANQQDWLEVGPTDVPNDILIDSDDVPGWEVGARLEVQARYFDSDGKQISEWSVPPFESSVA